MRERFLEHFKRVLNEQGDQRFRAVLKLSGRHSGRPLLLHVLVMGGKDNPKQFVLNPLVPMQKQSLSNEAGAPSHLALAGSFMRQNEAKLPLEMSMSEETVHLEGLAEEKVLPVDLTQWQLVAHLQATGHDLADWSVSLLEESPTVRHQTKLLKVINEYGSPGAARFLRQRRNTPNPRSSFEEGMRVAMRCVAGPGLQHKLAELYAEERDDDTDLLIAHYLEVGVDVAAADLFDEKVKAVSGLPNEDSDEDQQELPQPTAPRGAKPSGVAAPAGREGRVAELFDPGELPEVQPEQSGARALPGAGAAERNAVTDFEMLREVLGGRWRVVKN